MPRDYRRPDQTPMPGILIEPAFGACDTDRDVTTAAYHARDSVRNAEAAFLYMVIAATCTSLNIGLFIIDLIWGKK